jgi:hypothetical protein
MSEKFEITIEAKIIKTILICAEDARAYYDYDDKHFDGVMAEEIAHDMFSVSEYDPSEEYIQKTVHVKKV